MEHQMQNAIHHQVTKKIKPALTKLWIRHLKVAQPRGNHQGWESSVMQ